MTNAVIHFKGSLNADGTEQVDIPLLVQDNLDGTYSLAVSSSGGGGGGDASSANQTAIQAVAGSNAAKANAIQGLDGGKAVAVSFSVVGLTPTLSNVASSATSVTILASNASRRGAVIQNDSTAILYLKYGATASTTSFVYKLAAGDTLVIDLNQLYTGIIDGIWASANGFARVTELV